MDPIAQRDHRPQRIERLHIVPIGRAAVDARHNVPHQGIIVDIKIEIKKVSH